MSGTRPAENSGFLDVPGARLFVQAEGAGEPLAFIHAGICNASMWDEQVAFFAPQYRIVRYDTRGFGRSKTLEASEFSNRADLAAVLDHFGVESAHLVGCSRGGQIALDFALEFPDRVKSVTWVCGGVSGYEVEPTPEEIEVGKEFEAVYEAKDWERLAELETRHFVEGIGQPDGRADPALTRWVLEMGRINCIRGDEPEPTPVQLTPPAAGRLGEIKVPLLVIIGDLDEPSCQASADYLAANVAGARKVVFHGTAHVPSMERPDEFNRVLNEFLGDARMPG